MATTTMITSHTTRSIEDYLDDFAGRRGIEGYDDTKRIKIAEENRDFVWPEEMWKDFIKSIFAGYTIPLMVICDNQLMDGGNRSTVLMLWRQNKFTVKFHDWEGNYDAMITTPALAARWNRCSIPLTIITDAKPEERSQIYENYNKGIVLSTGQLLYNRKYLPLVKVASSMINRGEGFPFFELIQRVWKKSWRKTKTLSELALAYQIVVGSMYGINHFHTSFQKHLDKLMTVKDHEIDLSNLRFICDTISSVDVEPSPKQRELIFKKFIGAMICDVHSMDRDRFVEKWKTFLSRAYTNLTKDELKFLLDVGTSRAVSQSRVYRLSQNVDKFLSGNRNPVEEAVDDSDSDSESD